MVMTDDEKISPEEKLLKVVEEGVRAKAQGESNPPAASAKDPKRNRPSWIQFITSLSAALRQWGEKLKLKERGGEIREILELKFHEMKERKWVPSFFSFSPSDWRIDLRLINHLLLAAAIFLCLFTLLDFFLFKPSLSFEIGAVGPMALPEVTFGKSAPKPLGEFTKQAEQRNLFRPMAEQPALPTEKKGQEAPPAAQAPNLKVVAIATTEDGFEAIVEDVNTNQSYFLKKGDQFEGYEVESIDWKKVTLNRDGQKWELN